MRSASSHTDLTKAQPQSEGNVLQLAAATDFGATVPLPLSKRPTADGGTEKVVVIDPEYVRQMVGLDCEGSGYCRGTSCSRKERKMGVRP